MPLFERIKDAVGVGRDDLTYQYHCRECHNKFETTEDRRAEVECPECGTTGSRNIYRM